MRRQKRGEFRAVSSRIYCPPDTDAVGRVHVFCVTRKITVNHLR